MEAVMSRSNGKGVLVRLVDWSLYVYLFTLLCVRLFGGLFYLFISCFSV